MSNRVYWEIKLRRNLEAANHRYAIAQSEFQVASSSLDESARNHAREMFNKDLERRGAVKEMYSVETTQQNLILDLQRKLLNEEQSVHQVRGTMWERRNEVHDMQLELNEALGHKRLYETQLAIQDRVKSEMSSDQQITKEAIEKAYPALAAEIHSLQNLVKSKDVQLRKMGVINMPKMMQIEGHRARTMSHC